MGQGPTLTVLLDERLYKKLKAAAAAEAVGQLARRYLTAPSSSSSSSSSLPPRRQSTKAASSASSAGGEEGPTGPARERVGTASTTTTATSESEGEGGGSCGAWSGGCAAVEGFRNEAVAGPLYNEHCHKLLDQFVKTQMLSHYLSEGVWLS